MIKCELYCAYQWGDECGKVLTAKCKDLIMVKDSGVLGISTKATAEIENCDVDCDGATTLGLGAALGLLALSALH